MGELLVILLIVVILFGANKLPQLGAGLGQGIKSFKKALGGGDDEKSESPKAGSDASSQQKTDPRQ
jgi:sec-independent protein translocase protein TatA